jgi:hypothetical protein
MGPLIAVMSSKEAGAGIAFSLLFFLSHIGFTLAKFQAMTTRDDRLEALGLLVPGSSGLILALALAVRTSPRSVVILVVLAFVNLILGRAIYELIVFRPSSGR